MTPRCAVGNAHGISMHACSHACATKFVTKAAPVVTGVNFLRALTLDPPGAVGNDAVTPCLHEDHFVVSQSSLDKKGRKGRRFFGQRRGSLHTVRRTRRPAISMSHFRPTVPQKQPTGRRIHGES